MIAVSNLTYSYQSKVEVLSNVNFSLKEGTLTALLGPSGSGKSTLLRVLMGLEGKAHGTLDISGQKRDLGTWTAKQDVFAMVPQSPMLLPWKTVFENVLVAAGHPTQNTLDRVWDALDIVQLKEAAKKYPWEISLGMASRVAFARAFVLQMPVMLFDEPFAALDAHTRRQLQDWLAERIENHRLTALFVTHDIREALLLGQQIVVLGQRPATISNQIDLSTLSPKINARRVDSTLLALEERVTEHLK